MEVCKYYHCRNIEEANYIVSMLVKDKYNSLDTNKIIESYGNKAVIKASKYVNNKRVYYRVLTFGYIDYYLKNDKIEGKDIIESADIRRGKKYEDE